MPDVLRSLLQPTWSDNRRLLKLFGERTAYVMVFAIPALNLASDLAEALHLTTRDQLTSEFTLPLSLLAGFVAAFAFVTAERAFKAWCPRPLLTDELAAGLAGWISNEKKELASRAQLETDALRSLNKLKDKDREERARKLLKGAIPEASIEATLEALDVSDRRQDTKVTQLVESFESKIAALTPETVEKSEPFGRLLVTLLLAITGTASLYGFIDLALWLIDFL